MKRVFSNLNANLTQAAAWFLLLAALTASAQASATPAGRLLFTRGVVELLHEGAQARRVVRGDTVEVGDSLRTGAKASAQLRLSDGAMIALRSDTLFKVEQQEYDEKKPGEGAQATKLLRGGLRAITGAIGHERPSAVKLSTPVATIGIRGTVYDTIYIPPEGLPGLPDVPPGHYTMVLKGKVSLSNNAGELLLGVGEIGYVADADTPPVLRPDLSWMFAEYATLKEGGSHTPDTGSIDNVLTDIAAGSNQTYSDALGFVIGSDSVNGLGPWQGSFLTNNVEQNSSRELINASGGSGDLSSFSATTGTAYNTGSVVAGDSTINWGSYASGDFTALDSGGVTSQLSTNVANYITATNVLVNTGDLPTSGYVNYDFVGGAGDITFDSGSYIQVDFSTQQVIASLNSGVDSWSTPGAAAQTIADFYGAGITLNYTGSGTVLQGGTMYGRFVGTNADGAITYYDISDTGGSSHVGTAAFKSSPLN